MINGVLKHWNLPVPAFSQPVCHFHQPKFWFYQLKMVGCFDVSVLEHSRVDNNNNNKTTPHACATFTERIFTWWLCQRLQLSGFPCSYSRRDHWASNFYVQHISRVDFGRLLWFLRGFVTNADGHPQSACDVPCKAVGRMKRPHVPQQQSGLIVRFTIYL